MDRNISYSPLRICFKTNLPEIIRNVRWYSVTIALVGEEVLLAQNVHPSVSEYPNCKSPSDQFLLKFSMLGLTREEGLVLHINSDGNQYVVVSQYRPIQTVNFYVSGISSRCSFRLQVKQKNYLLGSKRFILPGISNTLYLNACNPEYVRCIETFRRVNVMTAISISRDILVVECPDTFGFFAILWDCSLVAAEYLRLISVDIKNKSVIELGAGTGFISILCHFLEAKFVTATDTMFMTPLLFRNLEENNEIVREKIEVRSYIWGQNFFDTKSSYQSIPNPINSTYGVDGDNIFEDSGRARTAPLQPVIGVDSPTLHPHSSSAVDESSATALPQYDVIIGSDIIFDPTYWEDIWTSLELLSHARTKVILAFKLRNVLELDFFRSSTVAQKWAMEEVPLHSWFSKRTHPTDDVGIPSFSDTKVLFPAREMFARTEEGRIGPHIDRGHSPVEDMEEGQEESVLDDCSTSYYAERILKSCATADACAFKIFVFRKKFSGY